MLHLFVREFGLDVPRQILITHVVGVADKLLVMNIVNIIQALHAWQVISLEEDLKLAYEGADKRLVSVLVTLDNSFGSRLRHLSVGRFGVALGLLWDRFGSLSLGLKPIIGR